MQDKHRTQMLHSQLVHPPLHYIDVTVVLLKPQPRGPSYGTHPQCTNVSKMEPMQVGSMPTRMDTRISTHYAAVSAPTRLTKPPWVTRQVNARNFAQKSWAAFPRTR
ncbi:hypothetical protein, unlikely [Trypanosoma brucei gambiense DAL972]|uniref:Uncharacterized protein n=1 Tax=Trypanosoma brucei gambiense (strain MHOM/CI/86/DAL972) TaxID=679716 RepID=C9ZQ53_TRYB9|nr:hypothetical protein, unlikely [Trypanosoma brucei gambiense DAL972]CBH11533.1 hypothetical protein, unlikely [Trypanosoma brucei gambiense DAL972]|eukprot:XP_011773818.1 hypothetical protein, unlikely [Trypanosoma brucei gambiense DAL972]